MVVVYIKMYADIYLKTEASSCKQNEAYSGLRAGHYQILGAGKEYK